MAMGRSQEDFDLVSSRTYISNLERGIKSPTIGKIDSLAPVLDLHPLALLALSYVKARQSPEVELKTLMALALEQATKILLAEGRGKGKGESVGR